MTVLAKINPAEPIEIGRRFSTSVRYGSDGRNRVGEVAYIWTNERRGGEGFVGAGILESWEEATRPVRANERFRIELTLTTPARRGLNNHAIGGSNREAQAGFEPLFGLYTQSNTQLIEITREQEEILQRYLNDAE